MAKFYKFTYSAGYVGTETSTVFRFSDSVSKEEVQEMFDDWYEEQRNDYGDFEEISGEEAECEGIDNDYTD